jgi:hypothetical protein
MTNRFKILIKCIGLSFCISTIVLDAQVLQDTASVNLIKRGIGYVYNFRFDKAGEVYREISQSYPGHPTTYLFKGMKTYWENYPLLPTSLGCVSFEEDMRNCIQLCEKKHNPDYEAEFLLANLCARGFLLLFYSDNDLNVEVFPLATSTYQYVRRAFDFNSAYSDFCFFTGLYDYYREAYPEAHSTYKALAFLFPKGDKAKGLKNIKVAAENSIFLKAESYSFLSAIFLSFENNYLQASQYSKALHELYPENLQYLAEYIKNLLLVKEYDEAERLMNHSIVSITNSFFQAQIAIFNGIIQEKKYHEYNKAQQFYNKGARDISIFGDYGNDFAAYSYFGLSRISEINGDKQYRKIYRKLALKLADFKKIDFDD